MHVDNNGLLHLFGLSIFLALRPSWFLFVSCIVSLVPFLSIFFKSISVPPSPEAFEEPSQLLFGHKWPTSHH